MDQNIATFEKAGDAVSGTGSGIKPIRNRRRTLRSALFGAGVIGLLTTGTLYGQYWWRTGRFLVSTDDAYLQADNVIISPKISGYILSVPVTDASINEPPAFRFSLRTCSSNVRRRSSSFILLTSSACVAETAVSSRAIESSARSASSLEKGS